MTCIALLAVLITCLLTGCTGILQGSEAPATSSAPRAESASSGPDLTINQVAEPELAQFFAKKVEVFGLEILATRDTRNAKISHAAAVVAQYLDNDQDGQADDPAVTTSLEEQRATLLMGPDREALELLDPFDSSPLEGRLLQDLYAEETAPTKGRFDASLEEIHHLLLNGGWSRVYPKQLGQQGGSEIATYMDIARGGYFEETPQEYPVWAWFSYDDKACTYDCMLTEYTYWVHTSLLGAQATSRRCEEILREWKLCFPYDVIETDGAATIFQNPKNLLPARLPDGNYQGSNLS